MSISQQASAVETAMRIVAGAAVKPSPKERDYLVDRLKAAGVTLRWLQDNEDRIRAAAKGGSQ